MWPTNARVSGSDMQLIYHTTTNARGELLNSKMPRWNIGAGDLVDLAENSKPRR
jgi:hypothetical protein